MTLKDLKERYAREGFHIVGIFGSEARAEADPFSDIDLAYTIDHDRFYPENGFRKLIRVEEIKKELEAYLGRPVDLVPYSDELSVMPL
jgi:predicted nucleotidyltransferase